jgi:hypothetical protein
MPNNTNALTHPSLGGRAVNSNTGSALDLDLSTAPAPILGARAPAAPARSALQRWPWLREPLLHFVVLGAAVFAVDHVVSSRALDPRVIVVGPAVDKEAREIFVALRGREPNPEELATLRRTWLDNEVLYREGLALQVDRGDVAIRERVIFKALSVVDSNVKRPPVTEQSLREWFEKNRVKYDEPPRFDFQEAVLSGENSESAVRAFAEQLNKGAGGDLNAGLRVFKGRPQSNVVQSYGTEFAKALETATPGEWRALNTREGWRAMRLESLSAGKPAVFETVSNVVMQDWTDFAMAQVRTQAVRSLAQKYKVREESSKP